MKKILKILISLVILGAICYQFRDDIRTRFFPFVSRTITELGAKSAPCTHPIDYTLDTFDARFNISKSYFLSALADAEAIWEKPFERDLFTYISTDSATDVLKVNLIYDHRQQATSKLASLGIVVKDNRTSYDALKAKLTVLKAEYNTQKNIFSARAEAFNRKQLAYESEVSSWNKAGGAPQMEYDRLQATRAELNTESRELQILQAKINEMVDEINAFVVVLNRLAGTLNISVDEYNTIGATRGESFTEGVYSSDGINREIDIYEFSSREKLVRVLAHELGHALDLPHVDDPEAIMYKLNQDNNETLTASDLAALQAKCGIN